MDIENGKGLLGLEELNPATNLVSTMRSSGLIPLNTDTQTMGVFTEGNIPNSQKRLLGDDYHPEFGQEYTNMLLAKRQSKGEQFLGFLNQAVVGEIIGGTIEGVGYLLDLDSYGKLLNGTEKEFGNWFSDIGKGLRTWSEESTPIYRDPNAPTFDPGSWSWWMQNGKTVASTLSLMLPSGLAVKGLSTIGKAMGAFQKISPMASWAVKGLSQAAMSRHMENMQEAYSTYEESYRKALQKGMSASDAQEYAAKAAAKTYSLDWAMFLQDIPQYLLLNRSFGKATTKMAEKSLAAAARMGYKMAPRIASKAAAIGWDMLGEGFEEAYQYVAAEESKYLVDKLYDPTVESSFDDRLNKYIKDGEFWTSAVMGALGAGVMQTAGRAVNDLIQGGDPQVKFLKDFSTKVRHANESLRRADIIGSESAKEGAITNFETVLFEHAASVGSMDDAKELIKRTSNPTPEDMELFDVSPEELEFLKENQSRLLKDADEFQDRWEANASKYDANKAAKVTRAEFFIDKYNEARKNYENKAKDLEFSIVNFDKLSPEAKEIFDLSSDILSNKKLIAFKKKQLNNTEAPLNTEQKKEAETLINVYEKRNKKLQDQIDKLEADRTDEDRKEDNDINIGGPYNVSELEDKDKLTNHSLMNYLTANEAKKFADVTVRMWQTELDKILKDKDTKPKSKPEPEEDALDLDDYVVYTKDGKQFTGILDSVDENGDYRIIPTSKWSEDSKYATKPSGETITVAKDKVVKDKRQYEDEDENFEPIGVDDIIEETMKEEYVQRTPQYMASYYHLSKELGYISDNNELHDYLLKSKGDLSGVSAEFYIDTASPYALQWFKDNGFKESEIKYIKEGRCTKQYINDLLSNKKISGNIPIGIYLVKDNQKVLMNNSNIYLYTASAETLSTEEKQSINALRDKILSAILKGNNAVSTNLLVTNGFYNNTPERGKVEDRLGLALNDIKVGVSRLNKSVYIGNSTIIPGVVSKQEGTPYAPTTKTINGKRMWVKLNPTKLTREHAEILYDAIVTRYTKGNGSLAKFPDDRVTGLNVGEVIQMLALFGEVKTNPQHKRHLTKAPHLMNKRLYVHSAKILYFGENGKINIHEDNIDKAKANKEAFVKWAMENKNYSIPIAMSKMGVGLNTPLKRTFKIGSWENKPDEQGNYMTHAQFLTTVPVDGKNQTALVSDLNQDMPFIRPNLIFAQSIGDVKEVENPNRKRAKTPPNTTKQSTAKKKAVKKIRNNSELKDTLTLMSLPTGTEIYMDYSETKDLQGNVVEGSKTLIGRIYTHTRVGGTILDLSPSKSDWNNDYDQLKMRDLEDNQVNESAAKLDEYLTKLKQKANSYGAKIIVDISGVTETKVVEQEEKKVEESTKNEEQKPQEDIGDVLNDILGVGMDAEIPTSKSLVEFEKETNWFRDKFGEQNIKEVDKLIRLAHSGRLAFSVFTSDCIYVFEGAPEGAVYHEAFHRVELGYLSDEDRERLYKSARKYFESPNATDSEISEQLAEGFRTYKLTGRKPKSRTIWQFFKDLYNFIYTFFTGNTKMSTSDVERLYDSIERGQYRYSKISVANFEKLKNLEAPMAVEIHKQEIPVINNDHELNKVVKFLTGILINTNNINNLNDIQNIKMSKMFEHIERQVSRLATAIDTTERQIQSGTIKGEEVQVRLNQINISKNLNAIFQTVLDKNYQHLFVKKISDNLRRINIKYNFDENLYLENKENNDYKAIYDQASYEINLKDNMLASVKFAIATLHKTKELDPNIGIQEYVDFNQMWNSIMYNLHDIKDSNDMMRRLEILAIDQYPYQELLDKIINDKTGYFKEQVRQSVQRHRHNFINFLVEVTKKDGVKAIDIRDADVNKASKLLISQWNLFFYSDNAQFSKKEGVTPDTKKIESISETYDKINSRINKEMSTNNDQLKDPHSYISALTALLNSIGVKVNEESVLNLINTRKEEDLSQRVFQTIASDFKYVFSNITSVNKSTLRKIYSNESIIRKLAEEYVALHPELISDMILGPNSNQYYVYSQNSYVSDTINRFKSDRKFLEDRLSKVYNDNSYYGNQMLESDSVRENISLSTFSMVGLYGQDGSNYLDISPIEDYLFKLISFRNDIVAFPTMADRRTYYMLKGLKTYEFDLITENGVTRFPEEAINILFAYAKSEKRRIDEANKFRDLYNEAVRSKNKERVNQILRNAVENYHYIIDPKGDIIFDGGSAYKFHHFPSLNNRENLVMDESIKNEIRSSLTTNVREELKYAEHLGIISSTEVDGKKVYKNILLPASILSEEKEKHGTEDKAIRNIIASNFINTTISNIENEKLFSGDPAFYKVDKGTKRVIEDKVKRLSVLSSTGDNFANSVEDKDLTDTSFNVATVATQKFTSAYYAQLKKLHADLNKNVLKSLHPDWSDTQIADESDKIADITLKPYRGVDPTDGQAWITPAMYRSLSIRLGEWSHEKDEAFNILISGEDFSKDIEKEKKVLQATFQPLKLVYFDLIHEGNLAIPTYHKASFATIFRAMGNGKYGDMQIIEVLDRMERKGKYANQNIPTIDMLIADSATKVGNRAKSELFDSKLENLKDLSQIEVYQQNFQGLRRQLITDPHDVDRTKTCTQFLKIDLSNLELESAIYDFAGKKITGKEVATEAFNCLSDLSNKGKESITKRLGYSKGRINKAKLIELLREDAEKSNAVDNLIDALHMMEPGSMYLELDSLVDHKWIQERIVSLITKYTVDVKLPGNQFIQFSNMGMRSINKRYTFEKEVKESDKHTTWLQEATDDLPFLVNKQGEHVPMGCIISINLFKHLIPNYDTITFEEKVKYVKSNPEIMGFRVPVQGQSSVFILKVMGVYPETIGDTITLPSEFVALTGSDFDIDKVYVVRYNYSVSKSKKKIEKIKFHEGDTSDPKFLSKVYKDRYGKIINAWRYLVANTNPINNPEFTEFTSEQKSIFEQIREQSDTPELDDYIKKILERNTYDEYYYKKISEILLSEDKVDENKFIAYNLHKSIYEVNSRKAVENRLLDSFFAVMRNNNHLLYTSAPLGGLTDMLKRLAQDLRKSKEIERPDMYYLSPRFNEDTKYTYTGGKEGIGPFALNNVHHILSQIAGLRMTMGFGGILNETDNKIDLSQKYGKDNVLISGWLSALIDAHVDVAKDPYIMDLNVNSFTYNVISLLVRGGLGLKSFEFLAQPILVELAKESILGNKNNMLPKTFEKPLVDRKGNIIRDEENGDVKYINTTPKDYVITRWTSKLTDKEREEVNKITIIEAANRLFNGDLRADLFIKEDEENKDFIIRQILVFKVFTELNTLANNLSDLIQASQIDTKKFGNNATEIRMFLNKILKVYESKAFTEESLRRVLPYDPYEGTAINVEGANFLGTYTANAIKLSLDILGEFSIYGTPVFDSILNKILTITQNTFKGDDKLVNILSDEIFAAIVSKFYTQNVGIDPSSLMTILENVPYRLALIKTNKDGKYDDLKDNMFLNYLHPMATEDPDLLPSSLSSYVMVPLKSIKDKVDRDSMIASFKELLNHSDKNVSTLARQLFYYAFFTSGFRSRIYSFHNFMPNELYKSINIKNPTDKTNIIPISYNDDFIRKILAEMKDVSNLSSYNGIVDEVIINNHENKNLIRIVKNFDIFEYINEYKGKKYDHNIGVVINRRAAKQLFLGYTNDRKPFYRPFIKVYDATLGYTVLKYIGTVNRVEEDGSTNQYPVYVTQNLRSYSKRGVVIKEYNMSASIIPIYNQLNVITKADEEEFLNSMVGAEKFADYTYVPRETQIIDVKQLNTEENGLQGRIEEEGDREEGQINDPKEYTDHSGGALGADTTWDKIGRRHGVVNFKHYYHGRKTPLGNTQITEEEFEEGWNHVLKANETLKRKPEDYRDLLSRDWLQVKNSSTIFAISELVNDHIVEGGTGWAVQMAIDANKPVYVFDQGFRNQWYKYNYDKKQFIQLTNDELNNLTLTKNFAGIGAREINEKGISAIEYIYNNTFNRIVEKEGNKEEEQITDEFPFISNEHTVFSTEPTEVAELVDEFGIKSSDDWLNLTAEQKKKLEDKYKHCMGLI